MFVEASVEQLRRVCDHQILGCTTSEDVKPLETILGQERAVRSLQFGLGIKGLGFNIYVAGVSGTGKATAVKRFLDEEAKPKPTPGDWCYVNNFHDTYRPNALCLPAGRAKKLQAELRNLIETAQREIRRLFDSEEYAAKREETIKVFQQERDTLLNRLQKRFEQLGFSIQPTPVGFLALPLRDGRPIDDEEFKALSQQERDEIARKQDELQGELKAAIRQIKNLEKSTNKKLQKLDREVALFALNHLMEELTEGYQDLPEVAAYLEEVQRDILDNLSEFRSDSRTEPALPFPKLDPQEQAFKKYDVNVLVDNAGLAGAPVIVELNPTYNNLFGRIEKEAQFGAMYTDFTMIREGSLHRANGGYLVLPIEEVLRNLFSWDSLKRALRSREITIEEAADRLGFITTKSLQPEPIPLDVKVVLIGQPWIYYLLQSFDEDFRELFKVKADFDTRMDRTEENIRNYAAFVGMLCHEEGLKHLDRSALAKIVEHGSRMAENQEKLSTKFGDLSDIIREASFYAAQENLTYVGAAQIKKAIDERFYRSSLLQERIREMIEQGVLKIDIAGEQVGQVNGLSVIDLGDIKFGRPNRITATIGLGQEGLIDIEKKAELGGPIHTKGVMILSGYLTETYAQDKPLSLSARLVFEQSYAGVEGDSASSTELYAILSSLSGLPVRQGIAVTGSVNQKGEIQAIGGVNEKIEGFFEICRMKGLTGKEGVLIPESNLTNLMLNEEVVQTVQAGQFHVWPVHHIDEGIEVLTGVKAGKRQPDGIFEAGTVSDLVDQRLKKLAEVIKAFSAKDNMMT